MRQFFAHWLIILAAWTLLVKFIFPLAYDAHYDHPIGSHIYWDFWWLAHLILAWLLLRPRSYSWCFGVVVSVVEIAIIAIKFVNFFRAPQWTIWQTNWFINKVFVLACFILLLLYLLQRRHALTKTE